MDLDFMTTKEKDYVNYIFTKNIKHFKSEVNYKRILEGKKQEFFPLKTELKTSFIFGKDTCRDNKKNRYFTSTENIPEFLKINCEIDNLITKAIFKKYFVSDILVNYDIKRFLQFKSLWRLLDLTFENSTRKKENITELLENFEIIEDLKEFTDFINTWYDKIPSFEVSEIDNHFLTHFMTNSSGLVLATCLLINNNDLVNTFYTNLLIRIETSLEFNEVWNFLVVLMKFCGKDQKFRLVKLTKNRLVKIRDDIERFNSAKNFVKCLGIEPDDIIN